MAKDAAYWLTEIASAKKREKPFRDDGERIIKIYDGSKSDVTPFNILFSNTETLLPALYSALPRPVVSRRFKDEDPIGKCAADAGERCLSFLIDTNVEGYETYDESMRAATLDALLPGRGVTRIKYDAEIDELPGEKTEQGEAEATPYKKAELACCDTRSWNRVYFGYAKKWSKVPWIAYEEHIDKGEAERLLGAEIAGKLVYSDTDKDEEDKKKGEEDKGERLTCCIYQVWDKGTKTIRYVAPQYKDEFLKVEPDPLGLTGFFDCPRPLQMIEKSNDLSPVAPYILYENQAKELNELTRRINRITKAIKAKAIYDGELGEDIKNLTEADDNALVPSDKTSSLAAEKGLQNAIWFWPIDKLITVLQQLYLARENCKAVIFEIMGLADVMRGSSQASETLGAQEIKQAWGGLRLKRSQKEVQRYARDLLRLMLEIAATKFSEDTWARMTGLPYLTQQQFAEAQGMVQAAQMAAQQPGPDGQPNPQAQQALQQAQEKLQTPQWSQVLQVLRDDMQRAYRIDIETNSTVEPEAVEDQKNIAEVMNALGQFLNGVSPLVAKGVMPFQAAQSMMLAIVRRFRFGDEIEDYIKQMKAPPPPDDGKEGEQAKIAAESQQRQAELAAKSQADQQALQAKSQETMAKIAADKETAVAKAQSEQAIEGMRIEAEKRKGQAEISSQRALEEFKARTQQETELKKAALQAAVAIETATITATKSAETATAANAAAGQQVATTADMMSKILARQDSLLAALVAPKNIERDQNGRALRLVPERG